MRRALYPPPQECVGAPAGATGVGPTAPGSSEPFAARQGDAAGAVLAAGAEPEARGAALAPPPAFAAAPGAPPPTAAADTGPTPVAPRKRSGKLSLLVLFGEIALYPFFIAKQSQSTGGQILVGGLVLALVMAVALRLWFGREKRGRAVLRFMQHRRMQPGELPGFLGLALPLLVMGLWLAIWFVAIALKLLVISLPVYLYFRLRRKQGLRDLNRWWWRKLGNLAVRLRRANYLGFLLPIIGGNAVATWLSGPEAQETKEATANGVFLFLLIQLAFLLALWGPLRRAAAEPGSAD